jgi:type IV pilus assembly protein PilA
MKNFRSSKGFTLVEIMIVVVIIGLLAAMAIPAFTKVRQASQEKTLVNDARQIASGAAQYYLEKGASQVAATFIVNTLTTPTLQGYVKQFGNGNSFSASQTVLDQGATFSLTNTSYGTIAFDETAQQGTATLRQGGTKNLQ